MSGALRVTLLVVSAFVVWMIATAVFERLAPRRVLRMFHRYNSPLYLPFAGLAPGWAVIETVGRRTGRPHRVPVGGRLQGRSFWLVAGSGRHAEYVRNIEVNPTVRVRRLGRWVDGVASLCPDDDPRRRLLRLNPINSLFVWIAGRELLTVRIDLRLQRTPPARAQSGADEPLGR